MQNAGTDKNANILTPASSNMQPGPVNNFEISSLQPMFSQSSFLSFILAFFSLYFSFQTGQWPGTETLLKTLKNETLNLNKTLTFL